MNFWSFSCDRTSLLIEYGYIWAGKYTHLEAALQALKPGAIYVIDDMLPQPNWPKGHAISVETFITTLERRSDLCITKLSWGSGVIIATKR